jgi:hypothetical protein
MLPYGRPADIHLCGDLLFGEDLPERELRADEAFRSRSATSTASDFGRSKSSPRTSGRRRFMLLLSAASEMPKACVPREHLPARRGTHLFQRSRLTYSTSARLDGAAYAVWVDQRRVMDGFARPQTTVREGGRMLLRLASALALAAGVIGFTSAPQPNPQSRP